MGNSLSCDSPWTEPCLGQTDPRYDPSVSDNLFDQDPIWSEYVGQWGPEDRSYNLVGGEPRPPTFYDPVSGKGWPYRSDAMTVYRNISIEGTRLTMTSLYFYEPASAEFCAETPPEGLQNVVGDGVCGENGAYQLVEDYGVSSYEKDGTINMIWKNQGPGSDEVSGPPRAATSTLAAADDYGVFNYVDMGFFTKAETFTFTGDEREFILSTATATKYEPTDPNFERIISTSIAPRMEEGGFLPAVRQAFADFQVVDAPVWATGGDAPLPDCVAEPWGTCPGEEEWCATDPSCSESPYQEPPASLSGGGIALVVCCSLVGALGVFYFVNRFLVNQQKKRIQDHFVGQIAAVVGHTGTIQQLGPEELAKEFHRIDESNDGVIQKEELWDFVASGKAGTMSRKDFDALFLSMDVDGNGTVNFMEFCGFMTTCGTSFKKDSIVDLRKSTTMAEDIAKLVDDKKVN